MGKKRTNDGKEKPQGMTQKRQKPPEDVEDLNKTPPGAQVQAPSTSNTTTITIETQNTEDSASISKKQKRNNTTHAPTNAPVPQQRPTRSQAPPKREKRQKLPRLPDHVTLTKRPIHHPAPPTPFSSSSQPKTVYLTATSPFIPAIKRIRHLLAEVTKRHKQSLSAHQLEHDPQQKPRRKPVEANGKLKAADLEREIVGDVGDRGGVGLEEVYVKATGRAIERALQVGVHFQGENDCKVRVEMGSVQAIDDISIRRKQYRDVDEDNDMDTGDGAEEAKDKKAKKGRKWKDEDIPETRIRTLSSITITISLK